MRARSFVATVLLSCVVGACSTLPQGGVSSQDRYSDQSWVVIIRNQETIEKAKHGIVEVEIHGLIGTRPVTVGADAIQVLEEGAFEVDLARVADESTQKGVLETATLLRNRGVKKIVFDRVGDAAIRARLDGDIESALILNREQKRAPAGFGERDPSLYERYSPARF